jgi:hypothetical protein
MLTSQSSKQQAFSFRFVLFVRLSLACLTKTDSLLMRVIKRVIKSAIIALLYIQKCSLVSELQRKSIDFAPCAYVRTYHRFALAQSVACDGQLLSPDAGPQDSLRSRLRMFR